MKTIALLPSISILLLSLVFTGSARAENWWSASAVTATPYFQVDGTVATKTFAGAHGRGVRLKDGFNGTTYLYIPVTAANGSTFDSIYLRAEDNQSGAFVKAEFIKQPRDSSPASSTKIGTVTTFDVMTPSDGFQLRSSSFSSQTLDQALFSYYIRLTLSRNAGQVNTTTYDVGLRCLPCPPPPK